MKHRGMTRLELAVVVLLLLAMAGFLVPALFQGPWRVGPILCMNRLRTLGSMAVGYAAEHDGLLPLAAGDHPRAFQSLQLLVETNPGARDPKLYVCPASKREPATSDATGYFRLTEKNVSYAWIAESLSVPASGGRSERAIACCTALDHHKDGIAVLYLDCRVEWVSRREIEETYEGFEAFLKAYGLTK